MTDVSQKGPDGGGSRNGAGASNKNNQDGSKKVVRRRLKADSRKVLKAVPADPDSTFEAPAELVACIELLYFAYRDFTSDPDAILADYGFGRAHHRVLHFVRRNPGLKVAELLDILKITKQSLGRVLKQLIDEGFVIQRAGNEDRRERRLYMSAKGTRLANKLTEIQSRRLQQAFAVIGADSEKTARAFLLAMISESSRRDLAKVLDKAAEAMSQSGR